MPGELTEQIVVRVPDAMHQTLKEAAEREERTVAQQVRYIIHRHLTEEGRE